MLSPFVEPSLSRIIWAVQQAPSVFNTQPWSFWIRADDRIELRANEAFAGDPSRRLPVTDPRGRERAISCGAALFNLRMAIRVTGHDVVAWLLPDQYRDPTLFASVEVVTGRVREPTVREQELYEAIPARHTYRWPFTGRPVPGNILAAIKHSAAPERGWLRTLSRSQVTKWLQVSGKAGREFSLDELYKAELRSWTSGSRPGLGMPQAVFDPQPISRNPPVRAFSLDGRPRERLGFESHPQLLSLATDEDRLIDWLRAGQALQRALLTATHYHVAASFLTQALELADHKNERHRWPISWPYAETPQMLIRLGYPTRTVAHAAREYSPDVRDLRNR